MGHARHAQRGHERGLGERARGAVRHARNLAGRSAGLAQVRAGACLRRAWTRRLDSHRGRHCDAAPERRLGRALGLQYGARDGERGRRHLRAVARSLLVTQWAVESQSAARITAGVFEAYAANPALSKAGALAQAERDMLAGKDGQVYRHPYYWGAYELAGDAAR
ncbi:CHAT domain-containing protein [Paraburkholderia silviterrae]|uniref:CHAT domain-containing protein n=1 Tax=Paraburkholderia silviterrae TaxID=2528715 RepID=A0A4V2ZY64_9BURK|nr:CHAT domain-containing protein [Paraburkholderia silviterrae]